MSKSSFLAFGLAIAFFSVLVAAVQADVAVKRSGATLTLTGNGNPETVEIFGLGSNSVSVAVDDDQELFFENIQNIRIRMGRGADFVTVQDLDISGNLDINMGGDLDDEAEVLNSIIRGNLTVVGASDARLVGSTVGRNMTVTSGNAWDLDQDGATLLVDDSFVAGKATVKGDNRRSDSIHVTANSFSGNLVVNGGGGSDDVVMTDNFVGRHFTIDGGAGNNDIIQPSNNLVGGRITVRRFEIEL